MSRRPRIVVLGSINVDLVVQCPRLPKPGETVFADSLRELSGGKGANQAVAAARVGGDVTMIGRVGNDAFAGRLVSALEQEGISTEHVIETGECSSGLAIVAVDQSGENSIMVVAGANGQVSGEDVDAAADVIRSADLLLMQLEIPVSTIVRACTIAADAGVPTVLDPAPAPKEMDERLWNVGWLCPNQTEAGAILARTIHSIDDALESVSEMRRRGVGQAIITMGDQGAVIDDGAAPQWIPPIKIEAVDSTAAGDAFAGAMAVRLAEGATLLEATKFASVAGGLAASRLGAQAAMPTREQISAAAQ